jgi:ribose/xylose/arabinose/galactoside ABC-type transport system permease subunit
MEKKPLAIMLISLILMFLSYIYSFYYPMPNFLAYMPLTFLALGFFMFGILAFSYTLPLIYIFYGLSMGANKDASIFIFILPLTLGAYAGAILGTSLEEDFKIQKYFLQDGKKVFTLIIIALILALSIEFIYPLIINSFPQDLFGFTFKESITTTSTMDKLLTLK